MIWVAESFADPHRAALDWLNKCTVPEVRFFGAELELWRIGDSPFAPKFNLVSKPNDWQKQLTQQAAAANSIYELYREFWTSFVKFCGPASALELEYGVPAAHWMPVYAIQPGVGINLTVSKMNKQMQCQIWIESKDAAHIYDVLLSKREQLDASLGEALTFDQREGKKGFAIYDSSPCDMLTRSEWPAMQAWLKSRAEAFVAAFSTIVKAIH